MVTGASRGIGRCIAVWLAQQGYDLILMARSAEGLAATAAQCTPLAQHAVRVHCAAVDVGDLAALEAAVVSAAEGFALGRVDVVVSNAGLNKRNSVVRGRPVLEEVIRTNLEAAALLTRVALRYVPKSLRAGSLEHGHWGRLPALVYVGSNYAREITIGATGQAPYIASKMGLLGLANSVFHDVRDFGVRVVSLLPALVATALGERPPPESLNMVVGELISEKDVTDALQYCLIDSPPTCCPTHLYLTNAFIAFGSLQSISERFHREGFSQSSNL